MDISKYSSNGEGSLAESASKKLYRFFSFIITNLFSGSYFSARLPFLFFYSSGFERISELYLSSTRSEATKCKMLYKCIMKLF